MAISNSYQKQINLLIWKYLIQTQTGTTILGVRVAVVRSNRYIYWGYIQTVVKVKAGWGGLVPVHCSTNQQKGLLILQKPIFHVLNFNRNISIQYSTLHTTSRIECVWTFCQSKGFTQKCKQPNVPIQILFFQNSICTYF